MERINPYIRKASYDVIRTPLLIKERVLWDYELLYIKEGQPIISVEDTVYHAVKGEMYLFRPGQRHSIKLDKEGIFVQPHVHFDLLQYPDRFQVGISFLPLAEMSAEERTHIRPDLFEVLFPGFPTCIKLMNSQYMEFLLFDLIHCFQGEGIYRELEMKWTFMRVLNQLLEEAEYRHGRHAPKETAPQIRLFLERNLHRQVKLEDVERLCHMDRSYLGRLFHEHYDTSIIRYHQSVRIEKCKELLIYTNATVTEVANLMGFAYASDLSRMFKKVTGVSPNQFRKANTGKT